MRLFGVPLAMVSPGGEPDDSPSSWPKSDKPCVFLQVDDIGRTSQMLKTLRTIGKKFLRTVLSVQVLHADASYESARGNLGRRATAEITKIS